MSLRFLLLVAISPWLASAQLVLNVGRSVVSGCSFLGDPEAAWNH